MADIVILNKTASIERCIKRIEQDYLGYEEDFKDNYMRQDAIILNIQRACEQSIDLANHIIKLNKWTFPAQSRQSFSVLEEQDVISELLSTNLQKMVGFRNIAIHEYSKMDMKIVESIIQNQLVDFKEFIKTALTLA